MLAKRGVKVNLDLLPHDDPAVYELLQRGDTVGVFQLESEGMRRTLAAVSPPILAILLRSFRSIGLAQWTISRCLGAGKMARKSSNIRTAA